jgi:hypothetical protein
MTIAQRSTNLATDFFALEVALGLARAERRYHQTARGIQSLADLVTLFPNCSPDCVASQGLRHRLRRPNRRI